MRGIWQCPKTFLTVATGEEGAASMWRENASQHCAIRRAAPRSKEPSSPKCQRSAEIEQAWSRTTRNSSKREDIFEVTPGCVGTLAILRWQGRPCSPKPKRRKQNRTEGAKVIYRCSTSHTHELGQIRLSSQDNQL